MRLSGTKTSSVNQYNGLGDQLYDLGGARPTLDLNFSSNESLVDSVTGKTLVDHTRQSSATYVDGDGVIRTAVTNYFKYSENIGFSGWNVRSGTTVTANQEDPNGSTTATLVTHSSGDGYVWRNDAGFTSGGDFVLSVYAKRVSGTPTLAPSIWLGTATGASTDPLVSVTDEWVRYDFNATRQYVSGGQDYGFLVKNGSVLLWGAQLEQSSTVGQYVKTTTAINSAPRFDHDPTTGESLGLLVEESRTNLLTYSEEFDNLSYSLASNVGTAVIRTANQAIAPDGALTADKFVFPAVSGAEKYAAVFKQAVNLSGTHTASIYLKGENGGERIYLFYRVSGGFASQLCVLTTEWQRFELTFTGGSTSYWHVGYDLRSGTDQVAESGGTVYLWGSQLEAGSFPTSYIPTEGSEFTRAADVASITGTNFSSWYKQSEGTAFVEAKNYPYPITGKALVPFAFSDNTYNNRITLAGSTGTNQFNFDVTKAGSFRRAILGNFVSSGLKVSGGYKSTGSAGSLDGAATVTSDTPNIPSVISQLNIGQGHVGTNILNGHIKRLTYWPTRLSNDTLQTITT